MKVKPFLKVAASVFITIILFFGSLELVTRLVFESNTVLNINIGGYKTYHSIRRVQLKKDYHTGDLSINSLGILGPEIEIEPSLKKVRILVIGDSVSFAPPERNYSMVLEERLNSSLSPNAVEVITGAVPGYSSDQALQWYDEFLYKLKPDIAIIYLGWNDMGQFHPYGMRYKNETLSYQELTLTGKLMQNVYFLRIPYYFLGRAERTKPIDQSPLTPEQKRVLNAFTPTHYENNLNTLVRKLQKRGTDVYLLSLAGLITNPPTADEMKMMHFPRGMNKKLEMYRVVYEKYLYSLMAVSKKTGTPIIDLRTLITTPEDREIFTDTVHINPQGSERFGEFIAQQLETTVGALLVEKINGTGQ